MENSKTDQQSERFDGQETDFDARQLTTIIIFIMNSCMNFHNSDLLEGAAIWIVLTSSLSLPRDSTQKA